MRVLGGGERRGKHHDFDRVLKKEKMSPSFASAFASVMELVLFLSLSLQHHGTTALQYLHQRPISDAHGHWTAGISHELQIGKDQEGSDRDANHDY